LTEWLGFLLDRAGVRNQGDTTNLQNQRALTPASDYGGHAFKSHVE
jgi:hypothetical protein